MNVRNTCVDLFCGCGGLSLGFDRAGFAVLAGVDADEHAIEVFKSNFPNGPKAIQGDLRKYSPQQLAAAIGTDYVDVIVGGPPCQGFSTARRVDGANNGPRIVHDDRRHLYRVFLRYVEHFKSKLFVIENVVGIRSAAHGQFFTNVQREARLIGYRVHPQTEIASELGVPQKRVRQLIVGTRLDLAHYFPGKLAPVARASEGATLGEAIGDLPPLKADGGSQESEYDMDRRRAHVTKYGRKFLYETLEVHRADKLTAHRARPHSARDLRDFARLREGENSCQAMRRGEQFEFPYDRSNFKDRYTRQHRDEACSTIVAHLSKDGLMFIHPTQNRSLTPREAARVQSFPDWFHFPVERTQQFRLIGNAVPPLVAEALAESAKAYLAAVESGRVASRSDAQLLPQNENAAAEALIELVSLARSNRARAIDKEKFKQGWFSVCFLCPELHPDSALHHGTRVSRDAGDVINMRHADFLGPCYVQSGWPVVLEPVVREAWRRYRAAELTEHEFYCSHAADAGIRHRRTLNRQSTLA